MNLLQIILKAFDVPQPIINLDHFVIDEDGNEICIIVQDVDQRIEIIPARVANADRGNLLTRADMNT